MTLQATTLRQSDRPRWTELWHAYLAFYKTELPPEVYESTWSRILADEDIHALAARSGDQVVGIAHYMFHPHCWSTTPACYLQDLFVDPEMRGQGIGRHLIEAVAAHARTHGATRLYWLTQSDNADARQLYDRLAKHNGFIRYDYPLVR